MRKAKRDQLLQDGVLSDLYTPETDGQPDDEGVGARLVKAGVITTEQLTNAQRVSKETPGSNIGRILVDIGADEASVQKIVAEAARLPFERVTDHDENAYDAKALHRLGPKYCMANLVLPLRREGQRLIMGTASPDDVFVLDDVKRQLGISSVKHVLVPASDIRLVLEALTEEDDTD